MSAIDQAFIRAYESDEAAAQSGGGMIASSMPPLRRNVPVAGSPQSAGAASTSKFQPPLSVQAGAVSSQRPAGPSDRRPLSAFAAPGPTVEARFKPALEVDAFRWPSVCEHLIHRCRDRLRPALLSLAAADEAGRSLIGIAAPTAGLGCTTLLVCLARLIAESGKSVAIVDGNFAAPGLARQLGLAVDAGWEDVLSGRLPLAESVVYSLADRIALLPLAGQRAGSYSPPAAAAGMLESIHASVTAGVLRYHYDMVLFDLGAVTDRLQAAAIRQLTRQCRLDGVVLTSSLGHASTLNPQRLMQTAPELASICLGVVEHERRAA